MMAEPHPDETQDSGPAPAALELPDAGSLVGGRYRVTNAIGSGGMGAVFAAENISVGRRCAIKFLRTELASRSRLASRFQREARLLGRLEHDHITAVLDYGYYREHSPFFVMEYLDGDTLRAVLQRDGSVPLPAAVELIRQICRGMAYAHERGIVHRDLKPENLMITRRSDGKTWVKILDFGVASWNEEIETRLTPTGAELGTAHYMSPEQARGAKEVGPSSDVYAIGAILYELLSGQRAHPGHSYNEVLFQVLTQDPRPLCEVVPACPPQVSALVQRCLNKEPAQRYLDGEQLLTALSELPLPHSPAAQGAAPPSGRPRRVWRACALGVLAGAGLGVGGALWLLPDRVGDLQRPASPRVLETRSFSALPAPAPVLSMPSAAAAVPVPPRAAEARGTTQQRRAAASSAPAAPERARPRAAQKPSTARSDAVPPGKFPFVTTNPYARRP